MKWSRAFIVILLAAPVLFMAGFVPGTATASQISPSIDAAPVAPPAAAPEVAMVGAAQMAEITDVTERLTPYLFVDGDGLVRLSDVTAVELGVTEQFLADFRSALELSNAIIERGEIVVAADMTVAVTDKFAPFFEPVDPGIDPGHANLDSALGSLSSGDADQPEWGAWNYGSGAMFYNTYPDWMYYRTQYYPLCNAMAAYLGIPWMGPHLVYFYGYNQVYFGYYCYTPYGVYYFIPYGYCQTYLGYKPAYFWSRIYYPGFGYQWGWRGVWCRY